MISLNEAILKVLISAENLSVEAVLLAKSLNRVLANDVFSDIDMPPFDKSAMDGYACRREDLESPLEVIEIIPAGKLPQKTIGSLQCSKIMTGAPIPKGADCVIKVEETQKNGENKICFSGEFTNNNICYQSEDIKKGQLVIPKATFIQPSHIALLASVGCVYPEVTKQPKVNVFSTGDELVEPEILPVASQIRNGNSFQIISQLQQIGISAFYGGIIQDSAEITKKSIENALLQYDLIILTGGVSMGDFDFIPNVLKEIGFDCIFDSIAVQPGKPTTFWKMKSKWCFGLPGNPVSSLVQTELLVKPFILSLMGYVKTEVPMLMPLSVDFTILRRDRTTLFPISIDNTGKILPIEYHGSAHMAALLNAKGFMMVAPNTSFIPKESLVNVRLL